MIPLMMKKDVPSDLRTLIEKFVDSDCLCQTVIFSLVDHKKYSRNEFLKYFPGSTKHQFDKARKYSRETFTLPNKRSINETNSTF